jgi:DNA-binding CsgD family transcriptional regulator
VPVGPLGLSPATTGSWLITPLELGTDSLLGRADELGAIEAAIGAVGSGRGRLLVIEGPAGIGKTALLAAAKASALKSEMRVLEACGGELEREFGFGMVRQLFDTAVRTGPESLLSGRARLVTSVLDDEPAHQNGPSPGDTIFPALQGLYWLAVNLSEQQPLVLLADDVHLSDEASIRFLAYLAQRLDGLRTLVIVGTRSGPDGERVLAALGRHSVLRPAPLTALATETLVQSIAPGTDVDVSRACHVAAGGNPLFVRELAYGLRDEGLDHGPRTAKQVRDWSPERVTRALTARLVNLPVEARRLAQAIAILGQEATLRRAALLAEVQPAAAEETADRLRAVGILSQGSTLEFVHPIVRAAVHEDQAPGARAGAHRRAASLLAAEYVPCESIAAHLVRCEPVGDVTVTERLVEAAHQAHARGAPEAAVRYLRRALEEPPAPAARAGVLLELAASEGRVFDLDAAADHLALAFEAGPDRDTRLGAALLAAALSGHSGRVSEAIVLLARVREEFADSPEASTSIQAHIANTARFQQEARVQTLPITQALRHLDEERTTDTTTLAALAAELVMGGEPAERVASVALRALGTLGAEQLLIGSIVDLILIRTLIVSDRLEEAAQALEQLLVDSRRSGSVLDFAFASVFRAEVMYRRGDLYESEADARAAYQFALELRWPMGRPAILAQLVTALIERGELDEAEALLADFGLATPPSELSELYTSNLLLFARGRLRAAAGDPGLALDDLLECGRREEAWQEHNPALIPWRSEAALAYHSLGQSEDARRLAAEELGRARHFGASRATGIALRAAALVTHGEEGLELARESVTVLADSPARLEHARALAGLGEKLLAAGRRAEARTVLRDALERSNVCGATALERQILAALRAAGARPRRARLSGPDALTPSERRAAQMAANGMSNRDIAEALFVTVRTVEFHLLHAYRKLHIDGRRELQAALAGSR